MNIFDLRLLDENIEIIIHYKLTLNIKKLCFIIICKNV